MVFLGPLSARPLSHSGTFGRAKPSGDHLFFFKFNGPSTITIYYPFFFRLRKCDMYIWLVACSCYRERAPPTPWLLAVKANCKIQKVIYENNLDHTLKLVSLDSVSLCDYSCQPQRLSEDQLKFNGFVCSMHVYLCHSIFGALHGRVTSSRPNALYRVSHEDLQRWLLHIDYR
jgi:hypothetical protein